MQHEDNCYAVMQSYVNRLQPLTNAELPVGGATGGVWLRVGCWRARLNRMAKLCSRRRQCDQRLQDARLDIRLEGADLGGSRPPLRLRDKGVRRVGCCVQGGSAQFCSAHVGSAQGGSAVQAEADALVPAASDSLLTHQSQVNLTVAMIFGNDNCNEK